MAVGRSLIQVEWSGADTVSISAGGTQTSDEIDIGATAFAAYVVCKADNAGTPAAGDTIDVYWLSSTGDPDLDPDGTREYTTSGHGMYLGTVDTNVEDPALSPAFFVPPTRYGKVYGSSNASSNSITFSAQVEALTA